MQQWLQVSDLISDYWQDNIKQAILKQFCQVQALKCE